MTLKKKRRIINHLCPNCMSTMISEQGNYTCSGDRYEVWKSEFKKYDLMNEEEQDVFLATISDVSTFLDLYKNKNNLNCGYSTNLSNIMPDNSTRIPDPMVAGKVEISLGRRLTEDELAEGKVFYRKGPNFSLTPKDGHIEFSIPYIKFPDDC